MLNKKRFRKNICGLIACIFIMSGVPGVATAQTPVMDRATYLATLDSIMTQLLVIQKLLTELIAREQEDLDDDTIKRDVRSVSVLIDHLEDEAQATVTYSNSTTKKLTIEEEDKDSVLRELSRELDVSTSYLKDRTTFTSVNADVPTDLLVTIVSSRNISLEVTYADESSEKETVPQSAIDAYINSLFFGMSSVYDAFFDEYAQKLDRGERPREAYELAAALSGIPLSRVLEITTFKVASNYKKDASN